MAIADVRDAVRPFPTPLSSLTAPVVPVRTLTSDVLSVIRIYLTMEFPAAIMRALGGTIFFKNVGRIVELCARIKVIAKKFYNIRYLPLGKDSISSC